MFKRKKYERKLEENFIWTKPNEKNVIKSLKLKKNKCGNE